MRLTDEPPVAWRAVFAGARGRLLVGLMVLEVATGIQSLVVTAILPAVVDSIGGRSLYGIALAASTLAAFVTIPLAGPYADRVGIRRALLGVLAVLVVGTVLAGAAPMMPVLVAGRLIQGLGAGALTVVAMTGVTGIFPARLRPRVLAMTSAAWIVPGLLGPGYGALLTGLWGWRAPILSYLLFLLVAAVVAMPPLVRLSPPAPAATALPIPAALGLFIGAVLLTIGVGQNGTGWLVVATLGAVLAVVALHRLLPEGVERLRRGLPATVVAAFLLPAAFFAVQALLPVLLTSGLHTDLRTASLAVTVAAVAWPLGTVGQSRLVERGRRSASVAAVGGLLVAAGAAGVLTGLLAGVAAPIYACAALVGVGMGLAYPALWLATMAAGGGRSVSATALTDTLGTGIGAGMGGAAISLGEAHHTLAVALSAALAGVIVLAAAFAALTRRMPACGGDVGAV